MVRRNTEAGLGNTAILYAALRAGSIDVYPEYSGTIAREILKLEGNPGLAELNRSLAPVGLAVSVPLGFNNTYALGVREELAARLGLNSIADLAAHPRTAPGTVAGVHRPQGRLARAGESLWPGVVLPDRAGSRPCLRGARRQPGRRDRHLLDRCQDRALSHSPARGRPRLLPALRHAAAAPSGHAAPLPAAMAGIARAGGQDRRTHA